MRRVFSVIGFTALATLLVLTNLNTAVAVYLSIFFLLCGVVFLIIKKTRKIKLFHTVCFTVAFFGVFLSIFTSCMVEPSQKYAQKLKKVEATVVSLQEVYNGYSKCVIKTDKIGKNNVSVKAIATIIGDVKFDPYDKIIGEAYFHEVQKETKGSNYARGIYLLARVDDARIIKINKESKSLNYNLLMLRKSAIDNLKKGMDKDLFGVGAGVLLGDKSYLDMQTNIAFKKCGIAHVLAVSGLHVAIISSIVFSILLFLGINKRIAAVINLPIILFYVALTGFSFSAIRAGMLLFVMYLGIIFRYEADSLNSLGLITLILMLINPYTALNISYLLSICAVLGLVIMYQPIEAKIKDRIKEKSKVVKITTNLLAFPFLQTISATLFCLPVMCITFGYVSSISPLFNLLIAPITQLLLASCALAAIFPSIGWFANAPAWYISTLAKKVSEFPYCTVSVDSDFVVLWMAATIALIVSCLILYILYKQNKFFYIRTCVLLSAIILQCCVLTNIFLTRNQTTVTFLDSGVGCCAVVTREDRAIIIGAGGSGATYSYLNIADRNCLRYVDLMILPNDNSWYNTETYDVADVSSPNEILISNRFANYYALQYINDNVQNSDDCEISIWGDVKITTRHLTGTDLLTLKIGDSTILFTDKEVPVDELTKEELSCDIVVFAGHVSKDYVKQINQTTIICTNYKNEMYDADYATCGQGDLILYTTGNRDYAFGR